MVFVRRESWICERFGLRTGGENPWNPKEGKYLSEQYRCFHKNAVTEWLLNPRRSQNFHKRSELPYEILAGMPKDEHHVPENMAPSNATISYSK